MPPVDVKKLDRRLEKALLNKKLVRIRRWIPNADAIDGFVVGTSKHWVLLAFVTDQVVFDGWKAIRREDIQSVVSLGKKDPFQIRALKKRGQWPPKAPNPMNLKTIGDLLQTASFGDQLVVISCDFARTDICWIGSVLKISRRTLTLLEVTTNADWDRNPTRYDLDDITEVDFGGDYAEALALVAGPKP